MVKGLVSQVKERRLSMLNLLLSKLQLKRNPRQKGLFVEGVLAYILRKTANGHLVLISLVDRLVTDHQSVGILF